MTLISRFGPPVLLMAVIFAFSAQPDLGTGLGVWDTILRKAAHMVEYGLLWWLWWRALGYERPAVAALVTVAYAASDELHQSFVDGRVGSPVDVAIDAIGVTLAVVISRRRQGARRHGRSRGNHAGTARR